MTRTRTTPTAKLTPKYGTSSGTNPGEDFESPEDLSDVAGIDAEIPRGNARPTGSLLEPKPKPRSPIGVEIGKSAGGGLGVVVSVPIAGGPISGRGGISLGAGGAIKGGSLGLGFGLGPIGGSIDVGTDQDESTGQGGCYQYVTFTLGPFSHTYGRNVCEPKPSPTTPAPLATSPATPTPVIGSSAPAVPTVTTSFPIGSCIYRQDRSWGKIFNNFQLGQDFYQETAEPTPEQNFTMPVTAIHRYTAINEIQVQYFFGSNNNTNATRMFGTEAHLEASSANQKIYIMNHGRYFYATTSNYLLFTNYYYIRVNGGAWQWQSTRTIRMIPWQCNGEPPIQPPTSLPIPNPPPKKMDDQCCRLSLLLQAETLRLLGREIGPEGLLPPQTKKPGFIGEEIERVETPILDPTKPKKIKVRFETVYELLLYALKQANNLDVALDPQSYKSPTGKVQNPAYNRDSEQSLKSNDQPNRDKAGNKREFEINKDDEVRIGGALQQLAYIFEAQKRLEYLFPYGELSDALIAKNLLVAGAKGDVKIHNMIQAFEVQMQYLNATFGDPRELITIKDANPGLEGDQSIEVKCLSISSMLREIIKFQIDTGGDVDSNLNLAIRIFRTVMANRIDITKTGEAVQALFEDTGMLEKMEWLDLHLEGDPYAGQWEKGKGFQANPDLEKKTEEATEKVLLATMIPGDVRIKVSRRSKDEKTDMRDLIRGLADFMQRLLAIPSPGDAANAIDKLIESAKFKVQTEMALIRQNVVKAASATRTRTRKRKK